MRPGSALSMAIHTGIVASTLLQPPAPEPEELNNTEIVPVALVTLEEITPVITPPPKASPAPPVPVPDDLAETIIIPAKPGAPAKKAKPSKDTREEAKSRLDAQLESILKSVEKKQKNKKPPPPAAPAPKAKPEHSEPERIQSASIQALVKARIEHDCWPDPSDMRDAETLSATIAFNLTPEGALAGAPRLIQPRAMPTDPTLRIFVERAFRAIQKCAPYDYLPRDKHAVWKSIQVHFSGAKE